ncbi:MAG: acyl-CoA dehydrogenase [Betaproteobacteria bacterium]|nr:acyl-CoA dehydrogenase [Betaproteobacteria bacterium]
MRALFEDSINRILADHVTAALLQKAEAGEWQETLFNLLDDGGFARASATEISGGVGAPWPDLFPVVFACGRHALPLPLPESLAACWLLEHAGIPVPKGRLTLGRASAGTRLEKRAGEWRLHGSLDAVPWGGAADFVVTSVAHDGGPHLVLAKRSQAVVHRNQNIAREARDGLEMSGATVQAAVPYFKDATNDPVQNFGALVRSAQIAGAMDRMAELCVQYANDRVQFGKPIGKFQAIQQQLAVLASESASVSTAAEYAFAMAGQEQPGFAIACAKARASEAAGKAAAIAHAVHGAIGFTYEHSLHYLTRRLWSWRSEFGTHAFWSEQLGRQVCERGGEGLWPLIIEQQGRWEEGGWRG